MNYVQWATVDKEHKNGPDGRTSKVTIKKEFQTTQEQLLQQLNLMLRKFNRHTYYIKNQFTHYRALKQSLKAHECLIHVDFSENYLRRYSTVQVQHRNTGGPFRSITPTGNLAHRCALCAYNPRPVSFCTVSLSRQKGPLAIWQHLSPVLDYV